MTFAAVLYWALAPLAVAVLWAARRRQQEAGIRFSSQELLRGLKKTPRQKWEGILFVLRVAAAVLMIGALARPQAPIADSKIETEGVDIVLALDVSTSMLAEDFFWGQQRRSRLEVVKEVVKDFIAQRSSDRLSLAVFAARPYVACPLTFDHGWLLESLGRVKSGMVEDGTAIGSGLAASLNRLRGSKAKSRIVVLLTDGRNNAGKIAPLTAAEAAAALKVKVYTIGVGSQGEAPYPVTDLFGNTVYQYVRIDLDEDLLKKIAQTTGAQYFRAADTGSLQKVYAEIDKLEKTPLEDKGYREHRELFAFFLIPGLVLLALEAVLSQTVFRKIP
jgi:Ca-activated chloride channel family protein